VYEEEIAEPMYEEPVAQTPYSEERFVTVLKPYNMRNRYGM